MSYSFKNGDREENSLSPIFVALYTSRNKIILCDKFRRYIRGGDCMIQGINPQAMQEQQILQAIQEQIAQSQLNVKVEIDPNILYNKMDFRASYFSVNDETVSTPDRCNEIISSYFGIDCANNPLEFIDKYPQFKIVNNYPPMSELIDVVMRMHGVYGEFEEYITNTVWTVNKDLKPNNFSLGFNFEIYFQCTECNRIHRVSLRLNIDDEIANHINSVVEEQTIKAQKEQELRNKIMTPNKPGSIILPR